MKPVFSTPVRGIIEQVLRSGDLDLVTFSNTYVHDPIKIHQMIQGRRPLEYSSEVPVSYTHEGEDYILNIGGRIDGVYEYPDIPVIDEIKTVSIDPEKAARDMNPLHWGQAKFYAFIYAHEMSLDEIDVQLTYYSMNTRTQKELRERYSFNDLRDFVDMIISRYMERIKILSEWRITRDRSIRDMSFPFPGYRSGQLELIEAVAEAIDHSAQLMVQAPTGIGKTMASLYPAIQSLGQEKTEKLFFLTARTTGRISAEKAVSQMIQDGLRLKSLSLTAKDKLCPFPDSGCTPTECTYAKGHYDRVNDAIDDAFSYDLITGELVLFIANKHEVCPFEFSLDLALWADCIVCDYNYVFDPRVHLQRFFAEGKRPFTFIIDEAHNLVDRARDMFSAEFMKDDVLEVRRMIGDRLPDIKKTLNRLNTKLLNMRKDCEQQGGAHYTHEYPEEMEGLLLEFMSVTRRWLTKNKKTAFRQKLLDLYFAASHFLTISELYDSRYVTLYQTDGRNIGIKLFCIDPSLDMKAALDRGSSVTFMSATLVPMKYFTRILGCDPDASRLTLPSPFLKDNLAVAIGSGISTLYRNREMTKMEIARMLSALVGARSGNYLFYFPSYAYMQLVHSCFFEINSHISIIVQEPGFSEGKRREFLDRFQKDNEGTLVGFAVLGGVFGEGIDLTGERLSGAAIVGVGLPGISPERNCIRDYFDETDSKGFEFAYQYPGINKVLQAAGRVIRTEHDRGVVLLIDQRYRVPSYKELMPEHWNWTYVQSEDNMKSMLNRFWKA